MKIVSKFVLISLLLNCCFANNKYNSLFVEYGKEFNIPAELLWAIAKQESGFNSKAINENNSNGTKDIGLMQINSIHEEELKSLNIELDDLYDPKINVKFGAVVLSRCLNKHGFNYKGLNCYNGRIANNDYSSKVLKHIKVKRKEYSKVNYIILK